MSGGVGPNGGRGSDTQVTRRITDLEKRLNSGGSMVGSGSVSLDVSPATSTVVTDLHVASGCLVFLMPASSGAFSLDNGVTGISVGAGSFTISHSASATTRTFNYMAIKPA